MAETHYQGLLKAAGVDVATVVRCIAGWQYSDDDEWAGGFIVELKSGFAYLSGNHWFDAGDSYIGWIEHFDSEPAQSDVSWMDYGQGGAEIDEPTLKQINLLQHS